MGDCGQMGKTNERPMGFLKRLAGNQAGNVMAMVAAAILPIAALIGGGLDMSRAYMVRARMQQACDAAALAGRRAMTTSTMTSDNIKEARKFFDFNFPQNTFGAASFAPNIRSKPSETTTVLVSAATTVPTTLMRIFGYETLNIEVDCASRFDIGNTDVMLVLDTTGSMKDSIADGNGGTTTRILALRQAVKDFYDALGAGSDSTGRIRYGFMPYSSTVNVGYSLPTSAILGGSSGEKPKYQTRRRILSGYGSPTTSSGNWNKISGSQASGNGSASALFSCPNVPGDTVTDTSTSSDQTTTGSDGSLVTTTTVTRTRNGIDYTSSGGCSGLFTQTRSWTFINYSNYVETQVITTTRTPSYSWEYGFFEQDVSSFIGGNLVTNPTYALGSTTDIYGSAIAATSTWSGCIEERETDSTITASTSTSSIPSAAYDLQINTAPTDAKTKWRPHWPDVEFNREGRWLNDNRDKDDKGNYLSDQFRAGSGGWNACPSRARKLASYSNRSATPAGMTGSFDNYVDGLVAVGGTYHDIGMIWGARFLSPTGIFASENANAPNGFKVSRHIIFMTDGAMSAYDGVYGAYGYQKLDARVAPANTNNDGLTAIHNRRLEMICRSIKEQQVTIWVVAFADGYTQQVQDCANSANHRSLSTTGKQLRDTFKAIAKNIGGLRLSE
jgi:Flp pilus assembly protein TadG